MVISLGTNSDISVKGDGTVKVKWTFLMWYILNGWFLVPWQTLIEIGRSFDHQGSYLLLCGQGSNYSIVMVAVKSMASIFFAFLFYCEGDFFSCFLKHMFRIYYKIYLSYHKVTKKRHDSEFQLFWLKSCRKWDLGTKWNPTL